MSKNTFILDLEKEKELYSKVDQTYELIKSKKDVEGEHTTSEINYSNEYVEHLEESIKQFRKLIFNNYAYKLNLDTKGLTKTINIDFIQLFVTNDKAINAVCVLVRNSNNIAYKSYLVKYVAEYLKISKSDVYSKINLLINLKILEEVSNCVRLTSTAMYHLYGIKNYRHTEIPADKKYHTKLYFNLIKVGYLKNKSKEIKNKHGYDFSSKRAIIIDEKTILYRNKNYFDANFFLKHSRFENVYVLSKRLEKKGHGNFRVKLLKDAINYEDY